MSEISLDPEIIERLSNNDPTLTELSFTRCKLKYIFTSYYCAYLTDSINK